MSVNRRNDELIFECQKRGIPLPTDKKLKKRDYVKLLGDHTSKELFPNAVPKHLNFVREMESPMLCFRFDEMKPEQKDEMWKDNNNWVASEKINGCRVLITYSPEEGLHFYSRNISVETFLPIDYAQTVWTPDFNPFALINEGINDFVVDGEILSPRASVNTNFSGRLNGGVVTDSALTATAALLSILPEESVAIQREQGIKFEFHLFHILSLNGKSYMEAPYGKMKQILDILLQKLQNCGLNVVAVPEVSTGKKDFYTKILKGGGEGIVFKNTDEHYYPTESRYHKAWVKCKRTASSTLIEEGYGDSIDGYITGFLPGAEDSDLRDKVATLIFSVYLEKESGDIVNHEIAHVAGLTDEMRNEITELDFMGKPILKQGWYGKVAEIDGQWISSKSFRLMHPKLVRFREDKSKPDCLFKETTLKKMVIE